MSWDGRGKGTDKACPLPRNWRLIRCPSFEGFGGTYMRVFACLAALLALSALVPTTTLGAPPETPPTRGPGDLLPICISEAMGSTAGFIRSKEAPSSGFPPMQTNVSPRTMRCLMLPERLISWMRCGLTYGQRQPTSPRRICTPEAL